VRQVDHLPRIISRCCCNFLTPNFKLS